MVCFTLYARPNARLSLTRNRQPVVKIATDTKVEQPVSRLDLVLSIQGNLLHIRVADEVEQPSATSEIVRKQNRKKFRILIRNAPNTLRRDL